MKDNIIITVGVVLTIIGIFCIILFYKTMEDTVKEAEQREAVVRPYPKGSCIQYKLIPEIKGIVGITNANISLRFYNSLGELSAYVPVGYLEECSG